MSRINSCLRELAERIEAVHDEATESFVRTEDFEDLLEETLRRVATERSEEKRRLYGGFLVNNIARPDFAYERRIKMLEALEEVQLSHLTVLAAMTRAPTAQEVDGMMGSVQATLQKRTPAVANELDRIAKDLERLDLVSNLLSSMRVMMTARGAADLRGRVTEFGREFLAFLTSGEAHADKPSQDERT
jgi:hypothetical protein